MLEGFFKLLAAAGTTCTELVPILWPANWPQVHITESRESLSGLFMSGFEGLVVITVIGPVELGRFA
jgi:hypothetical protein